MPAHWLRADPHWFPPSSQALEDPNGLLAIGGDLSPTRLIAAYYRGIFPWYNADQPILWWTPEPRAVFFPTKIHVSKSLKKHLRQCGWTISINNDFEGVVQNCAAPRSYSDSTWLSADMKAAYLQLHKLGIAHSIEIWQGDELAGGIYGLCLGQVFFGESMFSLYRNGSKVALVALGAILIELGIQLIDCQVGNAHLFSMGAENMSRPLFEKRLAQWATPELTNLIQPLWMPLRLRHFSCDYLIKP